MTILDKIIATKKNEVADREATYPVRLLEKSLYFEPACVSLKKYLLREDKSGIIAEFKRKSPSKGIINQYADIEKVTRGYMQAQASALSVLTDSAFFGGSNKDLSTARKYNYCPILRKDFVVSEYQILEAKSIGADAVLLIAAVLSKEEVAQFTKLAKSLGLEVLLEIHEDKELDRLNDDIELVGINNRNLNTFEVDYEHSIRLASTLPNCVVKIAESGIESPANVIQLKQHGFQGFLIGEQYMKTAEPELTAKKFIKELLMQEQQLKTNLL